MGAFKLETFEIAPSGGSALDGYRNAIIERERNEAYAQGFKDGVEVTSKAVDVERNRRLAALQDALADRQLTHDEATKTIEASLSPLLAEFIKSVAPSLLASEFNQTMLDQLTTAVRASNGAGVKLVASSQHIEDLAAEIEQLGIKVEKTPHELEDPYYAEIHWAGGVDKISMSAALEELNALLTAQTSNAPQRQEP